MSLLNEVDLLSVEVLENPYPTYALLREIAPVHWDPTLSGWLVTRYEDVHDSLLDPGTFSSDRVEQLVSSRIPQEMRERVAPLIDLTSTWMWMQDPPEHTQLRRLMHQGFTPRAIAGLREHVEDVVEMLLDRVSGEATMDLIADFAYLLPAYVMADLYGLPREDADLLKRWSDALKVFIGGSPDLSGTATGALDALTDMMDYFTAETAARRKSPKDDLIGRLVAAEDSGDAPPLGDRVLCANLLLVLGASYVTSMDMLGNGVLALLTQREQWELLKEDPARAESAINEVLRFDGPVQLTHRRATRDLQMHGVDIHRNDLVYLVRGSANRDGDRFPDPDRLDITRQGTGHVAFGAGVHYCIGAALARMEGVIALTELARRHPNMRLDSAAPPRWRADTLQFRGLRTLPIDLRGDGTWS